uniref:hypothetical protein n=1 Tax=Glaesserella sp. TaxID=2094731 RepID=UPI0035A0B5A4
MRKNLAHRLLLMVASASMLEKGTFPRHQFDENGGFVGSAKHANWYINNLKNDIDEVEFEIIFYQSHFCLIAHSLHIFINGSQKPLSQNGIIQLKDGDTISIRNYDLRVKVYTDRSDNVNLQDDLYGIVTTMDNSILLSSDKPYQLNELSDFNEKSCTYALLDTSAGYGVLDPLALLENEIKDKNVEAILTKYDILNSIHDRHYQKTINEYINTNIESYEPLIINNNTKEPMQPEFLGAEFNDVEYTERTPSKWTALSNSAKKPDLDITNIVDPLFFINYK